MEYIENILEKFSNPQAGRLIDDRFLTNVEKENKQQEIVNQIIYEAECAQDRLDWWNEQLLLAEEELEYNRFKINSMSKKKLRKFDILLKTLETDMLSKT